MQLFIGPAASGKSTRLMQDFEQDLDQGLNSLLILPTRILKDRVSMDLAQKRSGLLGTHVITLNQFIQDLIDNSGFARENTIYRISNFESYLMIKLIIEQHHTEFKYFKDLDQYPGLIRMIYSMVQEMRTSSDYFGNKLDIQDLTHQEKWKDLQSILLLYVSYLERNGLYDNYSLHILALEILQNEKCLKYGNIYMDGFFDYTTYQLDFLCELFRKTESSGYKVILTVPDIPFPLIQDTLYRFRNDFNCEEIFFQDSHVYSQLAGSILRKKETKHNCNITEIQAFGSYRELEQVANQISRLVGQEDYHYQDIAVISQDPDKYQKYIQTVFRNYSHPFFPGRDELLKLNPLIIFIRTIIRFVVKGIDNAGILSLIHSGYLSHTKFGILSSLNDFFPEYIRAGKGSWYHALEQKFKDLEWEEIHLSKGEFSRFKTQEQIDKRRAKLDTLKDALTEVLDIVFRYHAHSEITGDEFVSWIASLFQLINLKSAKIKNSHDLYSKDYMAMRKLKDSLQSLRKSFQILAMGTLSFSQYFQLFDEMIRDVRYRYRYYTRDSVSFLTSYDAREQRFKVVFILGLNEGEFPGRQSFSLSDEHERRHLNHRAGRLLLEDETSRVNLQLLELYTALTRSSEHLFLCHTPFNETGKQLLPSMYLEATRMRLEVLPCIPEKVPEESYSSLIFNIVPSTDWMNIYDLKVLLQYDGHNIPAKKLSVLKGDFPFLEQSRRMLGYYRHKEQVEEYYQGLRTDCPLLIYEGDLSCGDETYPALQQDIKEIIDTVPWTPMRLETAGNCRYKFFFSEVLGIKASPIPQEEIKSDLKGLFFHKVLEIYVTQTKETSYEDLPDLEALSHAMDDARTDMESLLGNNRLFDLEWLYYHNVLKSFVQREKELRLDAEIQSLEEPIVEAKLQLSEDLTLNINGRIDRVDHLADKMRIIDYKSSSVKAGKTLKFYIRPLFVNQGVLYARALDAAVHDITYVSIEKNEVMDIIAQMKRTDKEAGFPALWDQKSKELIDLHKLLQSGNFKPYNSPKDFSDKHLLDFYTPFYKNGVEMEWDNKCSYCDYTHACSRREKLVSKWS